MHQNDGYMNYFNQLIDPIEIRSLLLLLSSFVITYVTIPAVIRVARMKHLYDEPEHRSSHQSSVPTLGGVSLFASVIISISLFANDHFVDFDLMYASMVILFFFGIKDDILMISPLKKMFAQIAAALMISMGSDVRIPHLFNILGMHDIPYWFSIAITVFVIILIINSFNLIDGIDGLSASIAIVSSTVFGWWFYTNDYHTLTLLSVSLIGALLAFLRYNYSKNNKIFMGDTGAMIVGFIISIEAIAYINFNSETLLANGAKSLSTAPVIAVSILIVPLIDTLRVMFIRIINKKSPFKPDKNHIHHRILDLGFSHAATTLIMVFFNIVFIYLAFHMSDTGIDKFFLLMISLALFASSIPFLTKSAGELSGEKKSKIMVLKPKISDQPNTNKKVNE